MIRTRRLLLTGLWLVCLTYPSILAQPVPGDVFREYTWYKEDGDAGQALRVGGKAGQVHPDRGSAHDYINAPVVLHHDFDLAHAVKAEVVIEKVLCHDGTTGLAIRVNDGGWIYIPEAAHIPAPQCEYQHHVYPVVRVPLSALKAGTGNQFRMRVDAKHRWDWPQNLINGVHFRIYYDSEKKPHPAGKIVTPQSGDRIGRSVKLRVEAQGSPGPVDRVEFVGLYEDVNYEGDGVYRQWHYHFFHGEITNHIGTARRSPHEITWDTSWVPDQKEPFQIAARIVDGAGLICLTKAVTDLRLVRPGLRVEICKPYDVSQRWVTRVGEKTQRFDVAGEVGKAVAAQLVWSSWSPGYLYGIFVNGRKVFEREGPKYAAFFHRVTLDDTGWLKQGANVLKTGKTPKINGQTVHGCEINWPGIMVLIRYEGD